MQPHHQLQLILFAPLSPEELSKLTLRALREDPRGLQLRDVEISDEIIAKLVAQADGDARFLLNQIEWIAKNLGEKKVIVDPKLKELFNNKDYGRYADNDGKMHVCFLTNNDITGGNSGSPVINGDGELIGLAFDGNWESMSGDIIFEPSGTNHRTDLFDMCSLT